MTLRIDQHDPGPLADAARKQARRRLLLGATRGAPVLMTLASGPVSAALCTTGSTHGSIRPSGKQATTSCAGRSAEVWDTIKNRDWPVAASTLFKDVFTPALSGNNVTLNKVIDPTKSFDTVARNCVAALLNASTAPPLTPASILSAGLAKTIWTSYATKGYYEPTAGVRWDAPQVVEWIKTTYS